jgi:hypothetical protein
MVERISERIGNMRRSVAFTSAASHRRRFVADATHDRPIAGFHGAGDRSGAAGKGRPHALQR